MGISRTFQLLVATGFVFVAIKGQATVRAGLCGGHPGVEACTGEGTAVDKELRSVADV
jgi:hypothetical protein